MQELLEKECDVNLKQLEELCESSGDENHSESCLKLVGKNFVILSFLFFNMFYSLMF